MHDQVDDQQVDPHRMGRHKGKHHPAKREKAQDACRIYPFLGDRAYLRGKQGADIAGVFILCPCERFSDVLSPRVIFTECSYYIFVLPYFGACILMQQVVQVLFSYIGCCAIRFLEKFIQVEILGNCIRQGNSRTASIGMIKRNFFIHNVAALLSVHFYPVPTRILTV